MTDWIMAGVLGVQTIVLIYASAKLQKISRMMDRLTVALTHIAEDMNQAVRDMRAIQDDVTELEDFIKTALRGSK